MNTQTGIQKRKSDHIRINLESDVSSGVTTGLEDFSLMHNALPEIDLNEVDTSCRFLGFNLRAPIFISSMTGGNAESEKINRNLAEAALQTGLAMGLGSQRPMLEKPELAKTYQVRKYAPDIPLFGNIGAIQLNHGLRVDDCKQLVESVGADGLILHLNPLQEALQPEGEKDFSGLIAKIEELCKKVRFPILVKEVGWGISGDVAKRLIEAGVSALDVAGAGGTSWSQVEANRISDQRMRRTAFEFRSWGIPTTESIKEVRRVNKKITLIASGGIRNGIDIAKCIALGANLAGMAGRILKAGTVSTKNVVDELNEIINELRIAMFSSGAKDIKSLSKCSLIKINPRR